MMIRSRNFLPRVAAMLVGAAILCASTPARADTYSVQVYDDGVLQSGVGVFAVGDSLVFLGTTTHFSITNGSGTSNNPGSLGVSSLALSSTEQISSTFGATGGTHTIQIVLSQTDWQTPTGSPLTLTSSAGGSFAYAAGTDSHATESVTSTYQGFLDNTNTLFGQPAAGSTPLQAASASLSSGGTAPLVFSPGTTVNTTVPGGTPFSITDVLTFQFTLGAGSGQATANVSASTVASVAEPTTMALTGLGALGLIGYGLRRRKATGA